MYCSHAPGARKPGLAGFCAVAELIGLRPASILFFGQTAENIAGAAMAGMRACPIDARVIARRRSPHPRR
jgi:FMN phosphatase YigB (HAD superfamily)